MFVNHYGKSFSEEMGDVYQFSLWVLALSSHWQTVGNHETQLGKAGCMQRRNLVALMKQCSRMTWLYSCTKGNHPSTLLLAHLGVSNPAVVVCSFAMRRVSPSGTRVVRGEALQSRM